MASSAPRFTQAAVDAALDRALENDDHVFVGMDTPDIVDDLNRHDADFGDLDLDSEDYRDLVRLVLDWQTRGWATEDQGSG